MTSHCPPIGRTKRVSVRVNPVLGTGKVPAARYVLLHETGLVSVGVLTPERVGDEMGIAVALVPGREGDRSMRRREGST